MFNKINSHVFCFVMQQPVPTSATCTAEVVHNINNGKTLEYCRSDHGKVSNVRKNVNINISKRQKGFEHTIHGCMHLSQH